MAINIQTRIDVSGPAGDLAEIGRKMRSPRPLLLAVGLMGLQSGVVRLNDVLGKKSKDAVRTGRLAASLSLGGPDSVFELGEYQVEFGSNLPYAAQVQYGGTIVPQNAKALAIPLPVELKRAGLWPSDLDPNRELLKFVPYMGSKPNIIGLLIDPGGEIELRNKRGKLKKRTIGCTPYGPGPLYALAYWVTQEPKPFLYFSDEDVRVINEELWPKFLGTT
jgi:hypothetical protein